VVAEGVSVPPETEAPKPEPVQMYDVGVGRQFAVNVVEPPATMDVDEAESVQVGGAGRGAVTVTVAVAAFPVPPAFVPLTAYEVVFEG